LRVCGWGGLPRREQRGWAGRAVPSRAAWVGHAARLGDCALASATACARSCRFSHCHCRRWVAAAVVRLPLDSWTPLSRHLAWAQRRGGRQRGQAYIRAISGSALHGRVSFPCCNIWASVGTRFRKPSAQRSDHSRALAREHPVPKRSAHTLARHPVARHPVARHPVARHPVARHTVARHPVSRMQRARLQPCKQTSSTTLPGPCDSRRASMQTTSAPPSAPQGHSVARNLVLITPRSRSRAATLQPASMQSAIKLIPRSFSLPCNAARAPLQPPRIEELCFWVDRHKPTGRSLLHSLRSLIREQRCISRNAQRRGGKSLCPCP
jgi:hypothetical protein